MSWTQDRALKICVIGDSGVGKTSLVRRLAEGSFEENYVTTAGATAWTVSICLSISGFQRSLHRKLVLWDVTGHGGPEAAGPFLRGADAALVVSDAARPDTQMNMWKWVEGVRMAAGNPPIMLVVNKTDLSGPYIDPGKVMQQAREYKTLYRRTSAWTGRNVSGAVSDLVVWHRGPWSAIDGRPAGPPPFPRPRREVGHFDGWDLPAGPWAGDRAPAGRPEPQGSCVIGSAGRAWG
jgi:small GTP-binding protein